MEAAAATIAAAEKVRLLIMIALPDRATSDMKALQSYREIK
jgi:hypothetical protein